MPCSFENKSSLRQDLTFYGLKKVWASYGLPLNEALFSSLSIEDQSKHWYTNLGLWLSDQNPFQIRCILDQGTHTAQIDFKGDLLNQMLEVFAYLKLQCVENLPQAKKSKRSNYLLIALREGLVNAAVHRDYSIVAPITIFIRKDAILIESPGRPVENLNKEMILVGFSALRNKGLAEILTQLHFMENMGTGLRRIWKSSPKEWIHPRINIDGEFFRLTIPTNA